MPAEGPAELQDAHPPLTAGRAAVGIVLTAVGGYVDCFGYLTLSHVYTAQMSGNTVLIAVHAGGGNAAAALLHIYTVSIFVLALLLASLAVELGLRCGVRRVLALALAVEVACLAAIALWGVPLLNSAPPGSATAPHWPLYALIALTASAMGIQNTSLRMAGILAVFTTHVTGTLARATEQFADFLLARSAARGRRDLRQAAFSTGLWLAFLLGALLAAELLPRWGQVAILLPPIAALLAVILADLIWPFASASDDL